MKTIAQHIKDKQFQFLTTQPGMSWDRAARVWVALNQKTSACDAVPRVKQDAKATSRYVVLA